MKSSIVAFAASLALFFGVSLGAGEVPLSKGDFIPAVKDYNAVRSRPFIFDKNEIAFAFDGNAEETKSVARELASAFGVPAKPSNPALVRIAINPEEITESEGYCLAVSGSDAHGAVRITAHDFRGVLHAIRTLEQLGTRTARGTRFSACIIEDHPAFPLRGFMHDTGRNFQSIESLKKQLDIFARYKLNVFHWHLTDNPAWRIECKIFPELNGSQARQAGRDPEKTYSYAQIRELFAYARERGITIVPELDMPGHSKFFKPVFGFEMGTPQGIEVLKKLVSEFCAEIPTELCPYLHIGSDEVRIQDPTTFMREMEAHVIACGRTPIIWSPGLPPQFPQTILQNWRDGGSQGENINEAASNPIIDSGAGYLNLFNPQLIVQRHFFHALSGVERGNGKRLGGILCCWPDTRVDDKSKIFSHNAVWPATLAFAESAWVGRAPAEHATRELPLDEKFVAAFADFERRMEKHRERYFGDLPFDYIPQSRHVWRLSKTPYVRGDKLAPETPFAPEGKAAEFFRSSDFRDIRGAAFQFSAAGRALIFPATPNQSVYLFGQFTLPTARTVYFRVGFESPARSTRFCGGIPPVGKIDANGGEIFINGKPFPRPQWENPGKFRFLFHTWHTKENEIPYIDEELFWLREPIALELPAGTHSILVRVPIAFKNQSWGASILPVRREGARWVDDTSITIFPVHSSASETAL